MTTLSRDDHIQAIFDALVTATIGDRLRPLREVAEQVYELGIRTTALAVDIAPTFPASPEDRQHEVQMRAADWILHNTDATPFEAMDVGAHLASVEVRPDTIRVRLMPNQVEGYLREWREQARAPHAGRKREEADRAT